MEAIAHLSGPTGLGLAEAAGFTAGLAGIHALRRHADALTAGLACLATVLVLMIGAAAVPESHRTVQDADLALFAALSDDPATAARIGQ